MIVWIIVVVTLILVFFVVWRAISKSFRERCEEPKFRFLERLGADAPRSAPPTATTPVPQEEHYGPSHS